MNKKNDQHGSPAEVLSLALAFGVVHSVLASRRVKDAVADTLGERTRNGTYRFAYVVQSALFLAWGTHQFLQLPDRTLYEIKPPFSWLMRLGQAGAIALLTESIAELDMSKADGWDQLVAFVQGKTPTREPEAQGPIPAPDQRDMQRKGSFRFIRHPGDLASILLFWLFPRMTVNHLTVAVLATIYSVIGAYHEEMRLKEAYGVEAYEKYREDVPFMIPGIKV